MTDANEITIKRIHYDGLIRKIKFYKDQYEKGVDKLADRNNEIKEQVSENNEQRIIIERLTNIIDGKTMTTEELKAKMKEVEY